MVGSLAELVEKLAPPRAVWLMLPAGAPTEATLAALADLLAAGDALLDGGNSHFKDDVRRAKELGARGLDYLDVGTSGGVWGRERGYCLMIGGPGPAVARLEPVFRTLAPGRAAAHLPAERRYDLDLPEIAELWRRGSVVGSWLLDLAALALAEDPELARFAGRVQDSGEGRWTIETAIEEGVPATVLAASLFARFRSRRDGGFADKLLSALRAQFGGHAEAPAPPAAAPPAKG
jgi:6-phosphogluconate dehydrogenase